MVFNAVHNSAPSQAETLTLTDTGDAPLTLGAGSIKIGNDPGHATQDAARFSIVNASSIPASLAPGATFGLQLDYTANSVTNLFNSAILNITSNDPVNPTTAVTLHGIGTKGLGGNNQPSLATILRAYDIPTIVGDGPNDANALQDNVYPYPPDPSSQEVTLQNLVKAGSGPVTINVLASFTANINPPYTLGYYNPSGTTQLFTTPASEYQSTYVQPQGTTSFDPGTGPFDFYCVSNVQVANRTIYEDDSLNTFDSTTGRHFRFFPMETPSGTVVPNQYIMTSTEWDAPVGYDFTNIVAIVSNVMAPPTVNPNPNPTLTLQNANQLPGSDNLIFNRIQNPNAALGDQVHDTNVLQLNNTGGAPLIVNSVTLSDTANWALVNPPAFPLTIPAGGSSQLTIKFIAQVEPPHPYNETDFTVAPNNGGVYSGTISINSNDSVNPTQTRNLEGYWQKLSENASEPGLQTVVNLLAGYGTTIRPGFPDLNEGSNTKYYGEEVVSSYWATANSSLPVDVVQIDAGHTEGNKAMFSWYAQGSTATHPILTTAADSAQSLFPFADGTTTPATGTFTSSGNFGFKSDTVSSDDSLNPQAPLGGHYLRFYPVRQANGFLVPNTYIVAMEYYLSPALVAQENFGFQGNVYVVSNIHPATSTAVNAPQTSAAPAAPATATATVAESGVALTWSSVQDSNLQGYNIYTSPASDSGFSLLTRGVTGTSYTDTTAPPGVPVYYRITAVEKGGAESLGTEASVTTPGTAVVGPQSLDIGATPLGSTTVITPGTDYDVTAGGPGVTANADGFRFLFQQQAGDFDLKVQVSNITVAGNFATAGIMARSTLDTNSANVYMSASPVNYRFKDRLTSGGPTAVVVGGVTAFPGAWVRLSRVGNVFTGYSSTDGVTWTMVSTLKLSLSDRLYVGLAVASNVTTTSTTAELQSFSNTKTGPVTNPDTASAVSGAPKTFKILGNDTDPTGKIDPTTVTISSAPNQGGQAVPNGDGTITYTSAPGFSGTETFSYTVSDGSVVSQPATVTVTVVPSGLVTVPVTYNVTIGQSLLANVLADDTDSKGTINPSTLQIIGASGGSSAAGTAVVQAGQIFFTPAPGFVGNASFSYTVQDSNSVTSVPTLITFFVAPIGPLANPDTATVANGQSVQINVLANDSATAGLNAATVTIASDPNQGTVEVDPTTGIVTYTAATGYTGTDSFTYTVADNKGLVSPPATVTITVTAVGPVAAAFVAPVLAGAGPATIDVLGQASDGLGSLTPASVTITSAPADGTATVNASTGNITYTPAAGFVGTDTLKYTVGDGTNTSAPATLSLSVGVTINTTTARSVTFVDAGGSRVTVALSGLGTAEVFFTGSGTPKTIAGPHGSGSILVTGTGLGISSIQATGTTASSSLTITRRGATATALGGISIVGSLNRILAPSAELTGALSVTGSLGLLQIAGANGATITIGTTAAPLTFITGHVVNSSIHSNSPIRLLKVTDWTNSGAADSISAPSIATLISGGNFQAGLTLGSGSVAGASSLGSARIGGQIAADPWAVSGPVASIAAGSIAPGWVGSFSAGLGSLTIHAGGFAGTLTAGNVGSLTITGDDTGHITAGSIGSVRIVGQMNNAGLTLTNGVTPRALSLGRLTVSGHTINSSIVSAGSIGTITTSGISGSSIDAGVAAGTQFPAAPADLTAAANIASVVVTGRGSTFSNTDIGATSIGQLSLGEIITASSTAPFGIGAGTIRSLSATLDSGGALRLAKTQLLDSSAIAAYISANHLILNSFAIRSGL